MGKRPIEHKDQDKKNPRLSAETVQAGRPDRPQSGQGQPIGTELVTQDSLPPPVPHEQRQRTSLRQKEEMRPEPRLHEGTQHPDGAHGRRGKA